jgi:hypothetical protein
VLGEEGRDDTRRVTVPAELVDDVAAGVGQHSVNAALMADTDGDDGVHQGVLSGFE